MKHAFPLLVLLLVPLNLPASGDEPLPGRDGQYQVEGLALEETVWEGRLIPESDVVIRLERGGVLWYRYGNTTYRNGTWKQTGDSIYIETNQHYAEFRAVVRGDRLSCEA